MRMKKPNLQISNDKKELKNAKQKLENLLLSKNPFIDKIGKLIEEKKEFLNKREIANSAKPEIYRFKPESSVS
jgi:hypothetical protein